MNNANAGLKICEPLIRGGLELDSGSGDIVGSQDISGFAGGKR